MRLEETLKRQWRDFPPDLYRWKPQKNKFPMILTQMLEKQAPKGQPKQAKALEGGQ